MYYPIGWHKVLNLDLQQQSAGQEQCNIISIQANHERELFFILTTRSIHIWYPRPTVEIVCHRRSNESIESLGFNKCAVWRIDSSVIVVATERDQLLFYQLRRRITNSKYLLPKSSDHDIIYRLRQEQQQTTSLKNILSMESPKSHDISSTTIGEVPALTIFSFGKLDLSSIGVTCLMPAEEEFIVGGRNGDIYGVFWNGNVDDKFPWSLSKDVKRGSDYVIDLKFSSVLSGFALVFHSGRTGFLPLQTPTGTKISMEEKIPNGNSTKQSSSSKESTSTRLNYLTSIEDATCTEINHRYRLVAIGLKSSKVIVCNIDDINGTLVKNHELQLQPSKYPHDPTKLGAINCMRYSPDGSVLVTSWQGGNFALWSVFGSLLFCTQQWQSGSLSSNDNPIKSVRISCLTWGREGYNLWLSTVQDNIDVIENQKSTNDSQDQVTNNNSSKLVNGNSTSSSSNEEDRMKTSISSFGEIFQSEEVLIISIAKSNLPTSPHLTCSSDSIILVGEDRIYVGPSIPHEAKFDNWFIIDIPQHYLESNYPIKYVSVNRECKDIAISGNKGFAIYSIETGKWKFFNKKSNDENFSVCGDMIWWHNYVLLSCFNFDDETFELRAYSTSEILDNEHMVVQLTPMEIIRMSIFENRILVLYSDGTLGMFMLNLRRRPNLKKKSKIVIKQNLNSVVDKTSSNYNNTNDNISSSSTTTTRSNSIVSLNQPKKEKLLFKDVIIQISSIENLVISNLQANSYCISSIALTRLHFKNNRLDDSILLNACGKLFLLEREAPPNLQSTPSSTSPDQLSNHSSDLMNDLSLDDRKKSSDLDGIIKVSSAKRLSNSIHFVSASLKQHTTNETSALSNVTFKAVSVIATNVEQFWISPEISQASDMSYFKKSLWLYCGGLNNYLQVWLPLLNDKNDPPTDLYVPDRIMLPIKCDIYPIAIRSSAPDIIEPDDAIVLGAESDILYKDSSLFNYFPYSTVKRQCRVYLHRILRELLLAQHLGYYARKIAESCQSLPYFAHCFELLLHEVLEEEATSPVPLPDPMLPQIVRFIKEFSVYHETVVHCARKSELSMWSHLFDERAVGNPRRLFQECLEKQKLDTAASCLIILQSLDRNIVSQRMVKELIKAAKDDAKFNYLIEDLESFLSRAEIDYTTASPSGSPTN